MFISQSSIYLFVISHISRELLLTPDPQARVEPVALFKMEQLQQSCDSFESYPLNLIRPNTFLHNLNDYLNRINIREKDLFRDKESSSVDFWELDDTQGSSTFSAGFQPH